jgi:hypothetical protein
MCTPRYKLKLVPTYTYYLIGAAVVRDLYSLNPALSGWVPHVLVFIVPRQILSLGDPAKRSCDACESLGATIKCIIRHTTCRRRSSRGKTAHVSRDGKKLWYSTFSRGYVEQAFRRVCVRANLIHGDANARYLQKADCSLLNQGRVANTNAEPAALNSNTVYVSMHAPTAWCKEAAEAVWA